MWMWNQNRANLGWFTVQEPVWSWAGSQVLGRIRRPAGLVREVTTRCQAAAFTKLRVRMDRFNDPNLLRLKGKAASRQPTLQICYRDHAVGVVEAWEWQRGSIDEEQHSRIVTGIDDGCQRDMRQTVLSY